jgi:dTDP-4-amino-4,6-dideoxygalactose transaminase
MVDLKTQYQQIKGELAPLLDNVFESAHFILGPNVHAFEEETAKYIGVKHAISCASGTDALHLALLAAGIKEGDEVITTPFTFIATAEAIRYCNADPVFVDIEPDTLNIDFDQIKAAITDKTKAILPVHLFGLPANMDKIKKLAKEYDLKIIEDCAQSFGANYKGTQTGAIGDAGCFSFFPSKNLGCYGDGGLITTNSDEMAATIKTYRNHGSSERYYHDVVGYNSRLDEIQAAILRVKLSHINQYNSNRLRVAKAYWDKLCNLPILIPNPSPAHSNHVFHQYTLLSERRDEIMEALQAQNIGCAVYYPVPLHMQKAFAYRDKKESLPITEEVMKNCMSLPIFPEMTDEQINRVCDIILSVFK